MSLRLRLPAHLSQRHRLAIVAPASAFERAKLDSGIALLRAWGFVVYESLPNDTSEAPHYLAGNDASRLSSFNSALRDPTTCGLYCARGGYGATRILQDIDWESLRDRPRAIIGFSDVTALHLAAIKHARIGAIHAPLATTLGHAHPSSVAATRTLLTAGVAPVLTADGGHRAERPPVEGPLLVANLSVLTALVGTPHLPDLHGWLLLLEDCNERTYRVDRMLTQLHTSGALAGLVGLAAGRFSGDRAKRVARQGRAARGVGTPAASPTGRGARGDPLGDRDAAANDTRAEDVLQTVAGELGIPFGSGFPVGHDDPAHDGRNDPAHGGRNDPAIVGARYRFDAAAGALVPLERLSTSSPS